MDRLRSVHLYGGWLIVLVFVLTGLYMRSVIHAEMEADDVLRYSIRANHIYILLTGLLHLCMGAYWRAADARRQPLQFAGSALLFLATTITLAAFFLEAKTGAERPALQISMIATVAGVGLHLLAVRRA